MYEIGQMVVLPGFAVTRFVEEIRQGEGGNEYRLSYDANWYSEQALTEAQEKAASRAQWQEATAPRRGGRIVTAHRLGRRDRAGW